MRFRHVCLESVGYVLPAERITSDEIEARLAQVYERLHLPAGRLELMTGITERRFFPTGSKPGPISARAEKPVLKAKAASFPAAALLTVASIPAPALFRRTAGVFTDTRL